MLKFICSVWQYNDCQWRNTSLINIIFEITSYALKQKITNEVSTVSPRQFKWRTNEDSCFSDVSPLVILHISTLLVSNDFLALYYNCHVCLFLLL